MTRPLRKELRSTSRRSSSTCSRGLPRALRLLFYTNLDFYVRFGGMNLVRGLWQYQFFDMRQLLLVLVPLLTMRLFAEERRLGTLELLWTYPLRDVEIVAGKFLACLVVADARCILPTLAYPLLLVALPADRVGPARSRATSGSACSRPPSSPAGSSSRRSPTASWSPAPSTYGVLLFFWMLTWNEAAVSEGALGMLRPFSLFDRFQVFMRGGIDTRDVSYLAALRGGVPRLHASWRSTRGAGGAALMRRRRAAAELGAARAPGGLSSLGLRAPAGARRAHEPPLRPDADPGALAVAGDPQVLAEVTAPLRITVFYRRGERERYAGLLERLRAAEPARHLRAARPRPLSRARARRRRHAVRARGDRVPGPPRGRAGRCPRSSSPAASCRCCAAGRGAAVLTTGHGERVPGGDGAGLGRLVAGARRAELHASTS